METSVEPSFTQMKLHFMQVAIHGNFPLLRHNSPWDLPVNKASKLQRWLAPETPKPGPDLVGKLGKDGKLTPQECQRCMDNSLCLFCGKTGHIAKECPKLTAVAAQACATVTELQESFIEEAKKDEAASHTPHPLGAAYHPFVHKLPSPSMPPLPLLTPSLFWSHPRPFPTPS